MTGLYCQAQLELYLSSKRRALPQLSLLRDFNGTLVAPGASFSDQSPGHHCYLRAYYVKSTHLGSQHFL